MKQIFLGAYILLGVCAFSQPKKGAMKFAPNEVVAHRGAFKANAFPENSIAALQEAIRLQCTGSEFDVRMTADDSLIINHDEHFNQMEIEKVNYADLMRFTLSNGEPLPTLRQYLLAGMKQNKHTRLVLEIKPSGMGKERAIQITDKVLSLVKELKAEPYIVYISFDYNMLLRIAELDKKAITQYLNGDKSPEEIANAGISGIDYHYSVFQKHPEWIEDAKQRRLALNAWTVNDPQLMDWLLDNGFDFITTNEPELLLQKLKTRKK